MSKVKKKEKNNSLLDTAKGNGPEMKKMLSKKEYEEELQRLQLELVLMQPHC